ncbi:hypothetical protein MACH16_02980 [Marinomonas pontica]|uniref:Isoprenylcysteine carboxylmethyltransferase family protein n=1 Tax=Marinomonas pontica TaxID=264739 RepID=A0ABM8F9B6_9GAMM|nr:hypothetical protein MACH16_02980 [Marinomonas pontica]
MKNLELKIPPVVLVAVVAVAMWAVSRIALNSHFTFPYVEWWSAGLVLLGICIAIAGVLQFRMAGTTVDPRVPDQSSNLVVSGIYRYSRNPMYLGFLLALCGWCVFLGSLVSVLFLPVFILYMNCFQIVPEERFMQEKFGASYRQYRSQVRRWI